MSVSAREGHLSAECALAATRREYGDLHADCRRTGDVPLPYSGGVTLIPRCACGCHGQGGGRAR